MGRKKLIEQLESAADHIADMPREDLQILLRRAALMLRNLDIGLSQVREKAQQALDAMGPDDDPGPGAA